MHYINSYMNLYIQDHRTPNLTSFNFFVMPREYPGKFALKFVSIFNDLLGHKLGMPDLPEEVPGVVEICESMTFQDLWEEADMGEVIRYLRGGQGLRLPAEYRRLFPAALPRGDNFMDF